MREEPQSARLQRLRSRLRKTQQKKQQIINLRKRQLVQRKWISAGSPPKNHVTVAKLAKKRKKWEAAGGVKNRMADAFPPPLEVPEPDAEAEADAHQVDAQQADAVDAQQAEVPESPDADAEVQEDAKYLKRLFKFHFNF